MKKYWLVLILIAISTLSGYSQQKYSGQLFSKPLYVNPAFAGTDNAPRLVYSYLSLAKFVYPRQQNYASFDLGFKSSGFGVEYLNMDDYSERTQAFKLMYAHEFKAGEFKFRPAVSAGVYSLLIDNERIGVYPYIIEIEGDTVHMPRHETKAAFSAGVGFMTLYKDLTLGIYIDQINKPYLTYTYYGRMNQYPQLMVHADYRFRIGTFADIIPGIVYFHNKNFGGSNISYYIDPSLRVRLGIVEAGVSKMFSKDYLSAYSLSAGLVWKYFRLKYSYTKRKGALPMAGADHEITFAASLKK